MKCLIASVLAVAIATPSLAQISFEKVESRTGYGTVEEGDKGVLTIDSETIRFDDRGHVFTIPTSSVTELYYSRVSGRRLKSAIFISPILFLSKGRKHYVSITFEDEPTRGAIELKLDKKNYRGLLRTLEQMTGLAVFYEQEGIKDTAQDIAVRDVDGSKATMEISSFPSDAEIEIDGAFSGTAPRRKSLEPGAYTVRVSKRGYETWEREIVVDAGEAVNVHAELIRAK